MSDFTTRPDTEQEWQALLDQLRTPPLAQPRPFFYHRVQARLAAEAARPWLPDWVRRPAYAVLLGALVLALNGDDPALSLGAMPTAAAASAER